MDQLSVDQAASALKVSPMQIGRLIDSGELNAKRFGKSWAIDPDSLRRYRLLRPGKGRPLSEQAAWKRARAVDRLDDLDEAIELARVVRRRSRNERVRILPALAGRIDEDPRVVHGGSHAAVHHGAGVGRPAHRDVYVSEEDVESFRADYHAVPDAAEANVVLRVVSHRVEADKGYVPLMIAVLDLIDAADTRAASEALRGLR